MTPNKNRGAREGTEAHQRWVAEKAKRAAQKAKDDALAAQAFRDAKHDTPEQVMRRFYARIRKSPAELENELCAERGGRAYTAPMHLDVRTVPTGYTWKP